MAQLEQKMVSRMAPSNTGIPSLGNSRTLLVSHLVALKAKGDTILRIESTDIKRSTQESTKAIYDTLEFLGITYNSLVVDQATQESSGIYKDVGSKLVQHNFAYYCSCSTESLQEMKAIQIATNARRRGYDGTCRDQNNDKGTLRLNAEFTAKAFGMLDVEFEDKTFGKRKVNFRDIQDSILLRADGTATYMLSNVCDDVLSGTTNVVRGVDLLPQTAMQILLTMAIKAVVGKPQVPFSYTHLPLIVKPDGSKMSKRDADSKNVLTYKAEGYLSDAIAQYVVSLGNTSIPTNIPLNREQLVALYDDTKTSQNNVKLCEANLRAMNKLHMAISSPTKLVELVAELYGVVLNEKLVDLYKSRSSTLKELKENVEYIQAKLKTVKFKTEELKLLLESVTELQKFRLEVFEGKATAPIVELLEAMAA